MGKCRNCGKIAGFGVLICPACLHAEQVATEKARLKAEKPASISEPRSSDESTQRPLTTEPSQRNSQSPRLSNRYSNAYRVSRHEISTGNLLKWLGGGVALVVALLGLALSKPLGMVGLGAAMLLAVVAGGAIYSMGTHLCAQGEMLAAHLDTAINTSPFMSMSEKATAMGFGTSI